MRTKTNTVRINCCIAEKYWATTGSDEEITEKIVHNETGKVYVSLYQSF